jgi:hypothetical protein
MRLDATLTVAGALLGTEDGGGIIMPRIGNVPTPGPPRPAAALGGSGVPGEPGQPIPMIFPLPLLALPLLPVMLPSLSAANRIAAKAAMTCS